MKDAKTYKEELEKRIIEVKTLTEVKTLQRKKLL
jgi:hypothetical protein